MMELKRYIPPSRLRGKPELYGQGSFGEVCELSKSSPGEIDVLGALGASSAGVDDADEHTFLRRVADYSRLR